MIDKMATLNTPNITPAGWCLDHFTPTRVTSRQQVLNKWICTQALEAHFRQHDIQRNQDGKQDE